MYWVNYGEAERFCRALTERARASRELPEGGVPVADGSATAFTFGATLTPAEANVGKPYNGTPSGEPGATATRVGRYAASPWGLHDMHGNEFEWCRDWYHSRLPGGVDPDLSAVRGAPNRDGSYSRVRRGGAWTDAPAFCRSALRLRYEPERRADHIGFRVVAVRT